MNLFPALICFIVNSDGIALINVLFLLENTILFMFKFIINSKQFSHGAESCNLLLLSHRTT